MNFELAKELKDAGFPQEGVSELYFGIREGRDDYTYEPTLSELIEECGEKFIGIRRKLGRTNWEASFLPTPGASHIRAKGTTPEEAVARLWLALNKK